MTAGGRANGDGLALMLIGPMVGFAAAIGFGVVDLLLGMPIDGRRGGLSVFYVGWAGTLIAGQLRMGGRPSLFTAVIVATFGLIVLMRWLV